MTEPKVSVIVPVYNVAPYLDQCMESLVNQTYRNLEIVVVNDGSTDDSPRICEEWSRRDSRVVLVNKQNAGLGEARNTGMEHATGEYVGFVDSDDYVDRDFYRRMVKAALDNDSDVVQCNYYRVLNNGSVKPMGEIISLQNYEGQDCRLLADALVNGHNPFTKGLLHAAVWVCLFRRSAINTRFISERIVGSEDIPFKAAIFLGCKKVTFIPDHLCFYRYNDNSLTRTFRYDLFTRYITLTDILNEMFLKATGESHKADFLILYMGINTIRGMYLYNCDPKMRPEYFKRLVDEPVWDSVVINTGSLSWGEKLIYDCIRHRRIRLLRTVADLYYSVRKLKPY